MNASIMMIMVMNPQRQVVALFRDYRHDRDHRLIAMAGGPSQPLYIPSPFRGLVRSFLSRQRGSRYFGGPLWENPAKASERPSNQARSQPLLILCIPGLKPAGERRMIPIGNIPFTAFIISRSGTSELRLDNDTDREYIGFQTFILPSGNMTISNAAEFGDLIRQKRKALGLTQEEIATRCGVGLRFIVELEGGKPSCQLGKALTAAVEVGLRLDDVSARTPRADASAAMKNDDGDPLSQIPSF